MDVMSAALGGMRDAQTKFEKAADRIASAPAAAATPDSVDLSTEAVGLLTARNQYQMNAKVVHVADQMQKSTLDILA